MSAMKYLIRRKKLPFSRDNQFYTLTICLGNVNTADATTFEARVQLPVSSYREGLRQYRKFLQEQKIFLDRRSLAYAHYPPAVLKKVTIR